MSDPHLAAIAVVLKAMGHTLPETTRHPNGASPLTALGLPHRPVVLAADWFTRPGWPMLGALQDGTPVALLPRGRRWTLRLGEKVQRVDAALAATISRDAVQLYPRLPDSVLDFSGLFRFAVRGGGKDIGSVLAMAALGAAVISAVPLAMAHTLTDIVPLGDYSALGVIVLVLVMLALAGAAFDAVRALAVARLETRLDIVLQSAMMSRLLRLPLGYFRNHTAWSITGQALRFQDIRQIVSTHLVTATLAISAIASSLFVLVTLSPSLALVAALPIGLIALVSGILTFSQLTHERSQLVAATRLESFSLQMILGINKIRQAAAGPAAMEQWMLRGRPYRSAFHGARRFAAHQAIHQSWMVWIGLAVVFGAMALLPPTGLAVGVLVAFITSFLQLAAAIDALVLSGTQLLTIGPLLERSRPLISTPPEPRETGADPGVISGAASLRSVRFRYDADGPDVLKGVDLDISAGEFVALVGRSGSGKSTIQRLLAGSDLPISGTVSFDGKPTTGMDLSSLRRQVGIVLQNGMVHAGSLYENLAGATGASISDAWDVARMVGLVADIENMPMGMHTVVADGGGMLSGGQRQRILIAQALMHRPRLLLLDEATSALDNRSQAQVVDTLARLKVTRVVIAHRLSTIRDADRIVVLDGGLVVETGRFDDLMAQNGHFAALARDQHL
ncbi:ATP-binding cassette domain-containing protein [Devosia chinhatensis]|uniref:ATP-binding cassette domain-containing protein n=1 Tax=Devosia chinhatensis TaxID=429727 RepID=UPI0006972569|nr:ATP-binding cassette domain-containing protein [Devosia chinhatensis]